MNHLFLFLCFLLDLAKFTCTEEKCKLPSCRCQSSDVPGDLLPDEQTTPQMVLISFEDGINGLNFELYSEIFDGRLNPNRCPVKSTFFVSDGGNDYDLTRKLFNKGACKSSVEECIFLYIEC